VDVSKLTPLLSIQELKTTGDTGIEEEGG